MKIKLDSNLSYEGNLHGEFTTANHIRYISGGKLIGTGAKSGHDIIYYNHFGRSVGSVTPDGDRWLFKDASGKTIGSAEPFGGEVIYKDAHGKKFGSAFEYYSGTGYMNVRGDIIGQADTDSFPLRPIPLENWFIDRSIPSVCLPYVVSVLVDRPAAAAGLRAGDFIIGWAGQDWTAFDFIGPDCNQVQSRIDAEIRKISQLDGSVMLVYRPAAGESNGMAKGKILKLRPMPSGTKGIMYITDEAGPTFQHRNSINYSEQIKKIYLIGDFEQASARNFNPDDYVKETRDIPGAHQELRDVLVNGVPATGWFWVNDSNGYVMSERDIGYALEKAAMAKQPRITITSYPGAKIFISTQTSEGQGDPHLNSAYEFIGQTDEKGVFRWNGSEKYALPLGAKGLAFYVQKIDVSDEDVQKHPMITSLPANTEPAVRAAMFDQVRRMLAAGSGLQPEIKYGYQPIETGRTVYEFR